MPQLSDTPLPSLVRDIRDMRWRVVPDWESDVLDAGGLRLTQWLSNGQAQVVKQSPGRTIYRVDLPNKSLYLKHYRGGIRERLRQWFRASAARREWHKTVELRRRQISTVRPVALGEPRRTQWTREQFFLTEAIPGSMTLAEAIACGALDVPGQARRRRTLITQVARFIADAHRAGVVHDDLHAGNILLTDADELAPRLYLIDVPKIRFTRPLDWPASRDNLAMLYAGQLHQLSRTEFARFWLIYRRARPELSLSDPAAAGREVIDRAWNHARRVARSRDKRPLANNREFYGIRTGSGRAYAVRELPLDELERSLADPHKRLAEGLDKPLKLTHGSIVVESQLSFGSRPLAIAYKRYRPKVWWKRVMAGLRPSRARQSWICGHALLARSIATPRPLMACESRTWRERGVSYLATTWIEGALNLHVYAWKLSGIDEPKRRGRTRRAAKSVGRLIGRMHAWQISHHDLKGCNVLLAERGDEVDAYIIDLDGVSWHRRLSRRTMIENLARLATSVQAHPWLSRTDRLRFLAAYLNASMQSKNDWKALWRGIARRSEKIAQRLRRNDGVVA